jgi:AraC-like DNA-binding protein
MDLHALDDLSSAWGVSVESLIYRCREVGSISDSTYRRAFQRLNQLRQIGLFQPEPATAHPGEIPALLTRAFDIASDHGLSIAELADELHCSVRRVRTLLGYQDPRPALQLL